MALRDFYPLSDAHVQAPIDALANGLATSQPHTLLEREIPETPAVGLVNPEAKQNGNDVHAQSVLMEAARLKLLNLLISQAIGGRLLSEQLNQAAGEGVDYAVIQANKNLYNNIVQDDNLVQPENPVQDHCCTTTVAIDPQLARIHFFPALLIRIAEKMQQDSSISANLDPTYRKELGAARRQLQTIRQQLITANTGLVAFVAYKHKTVNLAFEDLMQEGSIGLIRAVDRFDPNRGIRFSTYAIFWIKQAISRLIVKQEKVVRLPVALAEKASVVFEAMRNCYLENNRWPSVVTLKEQCDLSLEDIKTISSYYQATHSLDATDSDDGDDQPMMAKLKQNQFALPLDELIDNNLSLTISTVVASLPEKEAAILNMRFGLNNHSEMTLQAIADQLHVTRERVRQIQNEALKKLKQQFGYDLQPFLEPNESY
jgi:RNA polymerase primary sigma factor